MDREEPVKIKKEESKETKINVISAEPMISDEVEQSLKQRAENY